MSTPLHGAPRATVTSTTLLEGLRDPANDTVWTAFVERYRPLVVATLRRAGLAEDEAEDVAQASLLAFSEAYRAGRYERERGRLRAWLFGIVRGELARHREKRARLAQLRSDAEPAEEPAARDDDLECLWEDEWKAAVLRACLEEVRREVAPSTLAAFEAFALEGRPAEEVARALGTTSNAVYGARRRVLRRMRELRPRIEEIW